MVLANPIGLSGYLAWYRQACFPSPEVMPSKGSTIRDRALERLVFVCQEKMYDDVDLHEMGGRMHAG